MLTEALRSPPACYRHALAVPRATGRGAGQKSLLVRAECRDPRLAISPGSPLGRTALSGHGCLRLMGQPAGSALARASSGHTSSPFYVQAAAESRQPSAANSRRPAPD